MTPAAKRKSKNVLSQLGITSIIIAIICLICFLLELFGVKVPKVIEGVVKLMAKLLVPVLLITIGIILLPFVPWLGATMIVLGVALIAYQVYKGAPKAEGDDKLPPQPATVKM